MNLALYKLYPKWFPFAGSIDNVDTLPMVDDVELFEKLLSGNQDAIQFKVCLIIETFPQVSRTKMLTRKQWTRPVVPRLPQSRLVWAGVFRLVGLRSRSGTIFCGGLGHVCLDKSTGWDQSWCGTLSPFSRKPHQVKKMCLIGRARVSKNATIEWPCSICHSESQVTLLGFIVYIADPLAKGEHAHIRITVYLCTGSFAYTPIDLCI